MLNYLTIAVFIVGPLYATAKIEDLPTEFRQKISEWHNSCLQEGGLTEDDFNTFDIKKGNPAMNCYMRCMFTKAKWMSSDEVLEIDYIKANVPKAIAHVTLPELDNCAKKAQGGECEKSYNFYYCMNQAEPDSWVLA